jgi:hypothetical protein
LLSVIRRWSEKSHSSKERRENGCIAMTIAARNAIRSLPSFSALESTMLGR